VEERAAGPQPAQPADQLHRALRARADGAGLRTRHPGELRPRRNADHAAAGRPAGRRPARARSDHRPGAAGGAADRAAGRPPRGARRRQRRHLPAAAAQRRLQGQDRPRGDRRQQPVPGAGQPALGAGRAAAALAAGAHPRRPGADGPHRLLPADPGRVGHQHTELLPAGEAAPAARARRSDAVRGRRRHAGPRGRAGIGAGRAGRARAALPGRGDRGPGDPAVRQVPAVEGPRRALVGLRRQPARLPPGARAHRGVRGPGPRRRRLRRPGRPGRAAARPRRRLAAAGDRRGHRRPHLRSGRPARNRQVPDDHQPAQRGCRRGQTGAVRGGEAGGARRRRPPPGRGGHGHVRPRPARQGLARVDRAGPDPAGAGARGLRGRAGHGRRRRGPALRPPHPGPLRRPAARRERRRPVAVLGAHLRARRGNRRRPAAGAAAVRGQRTGGGAALGAGRAGAAARHRRPDPAVAAPSVGLRRLPRHRPAGHPDRGRRRRPRGARGRRVPPARRSAAPGPDDRRARRPGARAQRYGDRPGRHRRDLHRALDRGDLGGAG
jgi:hypothetical protein